MKLFLGKILAISVICGIFFISQALAEELPTPDRFTLNEALAATYLSNPSLEAARAELQGVKEQHVQSISAFGPTISASGSYTPSKTEDDTTSLTEDPKSLELKLSQPIYRGGSLRASAKETNFKTKSQNEFLKVKEQDVLLTAVTAYMDVLKDQEIVRLNINNRNVLSNHLEVSHARFKLGDITKTDVSQSESRLAAAAANLVTAEGDLKKSRAVFEKIIGLSPDNLENPVLDVIVPASLEDALKEAETRNPKIHEARYQELEAGAATRSVYGEMLPRVDMTGTIDRTYNPVLSASDDKDTQSLLLKAIFPIFNSGGKQSRVREFRYTESQRKMELQDVRRTVREEVIAAWEGLIAAIAENVAREAQIKATADALEGVKVEVDVGSRTTLEMLDAEQECLDAQVAQVIAERNRVVATYGLLSAMGDLTAEKLPLNAKIYETTENFQNAMVRLFGTDISETKRKN